MTTLYDFTVRDNRGNEVALDTYRGKVVLIVNTATKCGLTAQYSALQALYEKYRTQGLEVLDFPCNQFREQAPEDDADIERFCTINYGTTFPRFAKIGVNGEHSAPLYQWLKRALPEDSSNAAFRDFLIKLAALGQTREKHEIKWNFTKFLIDRNGNPVTRFAPSMTPQEIDAAIGDQLAH